MEIFEIVKIPEWVAPYSGKLDLSKTEDDSPYSFPLADYQEKVEDHQITSYKRTIQCLNDVSSIEDASQFNVELHQDFQKLLIHELKIHRNGEVIDALDEENIVAMRRERSLESHIINNKMTVSVSVDDLRVGDCLEYASSIVETSGEHPLLGRVLYSNFWLSWLCPVTVQRVKVINNAGKELKVLLSTNNNGEELIEESIIGSNQEFEKTYYDLPARKIPNTTPSWFWDSFMQISTAMDWNYASSYMFNYMEQTGVLENNIELSEIDELELNGKSFEQKAIELIRFVQNNIRYKGEHHGIFTHTPKPPQKTLKKRSGDCKDKSNLLVALLRSIGVEADLVLVNTSFGRKIKDMNPSPYHFNHMIVRVLLNDQYWFVDATIQKQSGDQKSSAKLDYGWGLPLVRDSGDLVMIESNLADKVFKLEHQFDFSSKNVDDFKLFVRRSYWFHRADNMRSYLTSTDKNRLSEDFLGWTQSDTGLELEIVESAKIESDKDNQLVLTESYVIKNIDKTHKDKRIELLTDFYQNFPIPNRDDYPVQVECDGQLEHFITVIYPEPVEVEESQVKYQNDFFDYIDEVKRDRSRMSYMTKIEPTARVVEASEVKAYKAEIEKIRARSNNLIYHSRKKSSDDDLDFWEWFQFGIIFFGLLWFFFRWLLN